MPGIPKIPKLSKESSGTKPSEKATPEIGATRGSTVEIKPVSPDSVPPGGAGEVTLTGEGLHKGMKLSFHCSGNEIQAENLRVTAPDHAVVEISVPVAAQEGP